MTLLCIYDAIIQHGDGDDPDGLQAIIDGACKSPDEGKEWRESVGRVKCLQKLCSDKNFSLVTPFYN